MRWTGNRRSGRLLGAQLLGDRRSEVAKRIDITVAALFSPFTVEEVSDLDLSYTPRWAASGTRPDGAQAWVRAWASLQSHLDPFPVS
jgi:hypothetical protein